MAENKKHVYDESKIKTLSSLEHIRLRTGMYIGRIGDGSHYDDGCYILLKEVIDNAIDEFIMGYGKEVQLDIEGTTVSVRDFGRGIPLGKVVDCVSKINTGAKYNDDVFQFSVGLNGVGTKAVNALSREFLVRSHRGGEFVEASFKTGKLKNEKNGKAAGEPDGTFIRFVPDPEIFKDSAVPPGIRGAAAAALQLPQHRPQAHLQRADLRLAQRPAGPGAGGFARGQRRADLPAAALLRARRWSFVSPTATAVTARRFISFVNGQYTSDGGTHLSAFREGLLKAVNEFAKGKFEGDDVRECMIGAVSIRLKDPVFESQTKNKLGNTEIRSDLVNTVREELLHFFNRNKEVAEKIMAKAQDTQQLRKELQEVKKLARERAKAITLRIPQLKDCKIHFDKAKGKGRGSMIFLTEGQSAAGSIVSCRDVNTQAIFVLKGKPLNVWDLKRDIVYKNDEMYNLMRSLDIEDNIEGLRYEKVDPGHRRRRGRPAHPQFAHHLFLPLLRSAGA